jgi:hypothetical protein
MDLSREISSTYAIGGVRGFLDFLCLHEDTKANACPNFFCLCLRDSAEYQDAPMRGFPRALGIMKNLGMFEVPSGWIALLQNSGCSVKFGSVFSSTKFNCPSMFSRQVIRRWMTATAMLIKVGLLVLWCVVLFTCAKGLVSWLVFHVLVPI